MEFPWEQVNDYILEVGREKNGEDLLAAAFTRLPALVDCDFAHLVRLGPIDASADLYARDYGVLSTRSVGIPCQFEKQYPYYFSKTDMRTTRLPGKPLLFSTDIKHFEGSEFGEEWARPLGMQYSIGFSLAGPHFSPTELLILYRSSKRLSFTERDLDILGVIQPHVANLVAPRSVMRELGNARGLPSCFVGRLSPREADVCRLVVEDMTAPEIADRLFVSVRTVEKHLEHIYGKLGASGKRDLRRILR